MKKVFIKLISAVLCCFLCILCASCDILGKDNGFDADSLKGIIANKVDKRFIDSLNGFHMDIAFPYDLSESSKDIINSAIDKVNAKYSTAISIDYEKMTDSSSVSYAKMTDLLGMIKDGKLCDVDAAAKSIGIEFGGELYNREICNVLNINYHQYGWFSDIATPEMPNVLVCNSKMLNVTNLPDDEIDKNNWNVATFEKWVKSVKNVGGMKANPSSLLQSLCLSNGQALVSYETGKSPSINIGSLAVTAAAKTEYEMFNELSCVSFGIDVHSDVEQFINGEYAVMLADSEHLLELAKCMRFNKSMDIHVYPMPNQLGVGNYSNSYDAVYFAYIPSQYEKSADKILFLQNEIYNELLESGEKIFENEFAFLGESTKDAYSVKTSKAQNDCVVALSGICEHFANIGTNSFALSIALGTSADKARDKYENAIKQYYLTKLSKYKITGNTLI